MKLHDFPHACFYFIFCLLLCHQKKEKEKKKTPSLTSLFFPSFPPPSFYPSPPLTNKQTNKPSLHSNSPFGLEKGRALREARERDLRDPSTDQILWCGDGSGDFPAALESDLVLARENTSLERLCRANNVVHTSFSTFATVQSIAEEWLQNHPGAQTSEEVKAYYKSWQLKVSNPQEP